MLVRVIFVFQESHDVDFWTYLRVHVPPKYVLGFCRCPSKRRRGSVGKYGTLLIWSNEIDVTRTGEGGEGVREVSAVSERGWRRWENVSDVPEKRDLVSPLAIITTFTFMSAGSRQTAGLIQMWTATRMSQRKHTFGCSTCWNHFHADDPRMYSLFMFLLGYFEKYTRWRNKALNWEGTIEHLLLVWFIVHAHSNTIPGVELSLIRCWVQHAVTAVCISRTRQMHKQLHKWTCGNSCTHQYTCSQQHSLVCFECTMLSTLQEQGRWTWVGKANAQTWFLVSNLRTCLESWMLNAVYSTTTCCNCCTQQTICMHTTTPSQVLNPPSHALSATTVMVRPQMGEQSVMPHLVFLKHDSLWRIVSSQRSAAHLCAAIVQ